jgi:hypothetical protein
MRQEVSNLAVPTVAGVEVAARVDRFVDKTIQMIDVPGTFVGDITIEGSLDGTAWSPLVSTITAAGFERITASVTWIRVRLNSSTGTAMTAKWAGFDSRTDGG